MHKSLFYILQADYESVLKHSINCFNSKFEYFHKNISNMDELFEVSFTKLSESGKPLSRYFVTVISAIFTIYFDKYILPFRRS